MALSDDLESLSKHQTPPVAGSRTKRALAALKPSFLSNRLKTRKIHPTSYLDGLRGVAAFIVVISHYILQFTPHMTQGWRSNPDVVNESILQLPLIRIIHSGRTSVAIFFVISGYVLSHKSLGLCRQRQFTQFARTLSSSAFRRWFRLMIPALASTLFTFMLVRANFGTFLDPLWAGEALPYHHKNEERGFVGQGLPVRMNSVVAQAGDWFRDVESIVNPFRFGSVFFPKYNTPLWTLQVEFMASMIVFMVTLSIAFIQPRFRIAVPAFLASFCFYNGLWMWVLFLEGLCLAEMSYMSYDMYRILPGGSAITPSARKAIAWTGFILCCYIGSWPEHYPTTSPGFVSLAALVPDTSIYATDKGPPLLIFCSGLMVFILENAECLQDIFTSKFAQYLGDISLAIYMVHQPIIVTFGNWVMVAFMAHTGSFAFSLTSKLFLPLSGRAPGG